jgi:hypothetical protein
MNWLKDHMFIATWLGPVIAIVIAIMKGRKTEGLPIDWFRFVMYFTLFSLSRRYVHATVR